MGNLTPSKEKELKTGAQAFVLSGTKELLPGGTHMLAHYEAQLARVEHSQCVLCWRTTTPHGSDLWV